MKKLNFLNLKCLVLVVVVVPSEWSTVGVIVVVVIGGFSSSRGRSPTLTWDGRLGVGNSTVLREWEVFTGTVPGS